MTSHTQHYEAPLQNSIGNTLACDVDSSLASNNPILVDGMSSSLDFNYSSLGVAIFSMSNNL